jgi:hypothetical protein
MPTRGFLFGSEPIARHYGFLTLEDDIGIASSCRLCLRRSIAQPAVVLALLPSLACSSAHAV